MTGGSKKKTTSPRTKANTPRSPQAPGQFYGYSIQTTRMVARLLQCTQGQAVSLEVLDDVAVTGGTTVAEQSKSGLAHNPVTDRSVELWKTLFNWLEAIRSGALTTETKFVLYVAQPHSGNLVKKLHDVQTLSNASRLIAELRDDLWGPAPEHRKKADLPSTLQKYVNGVLDASDDMLARLFMGFEHLQGSGSPVDDLTPLLRLKAIGDGAIEEVLNSILGWTKKRVERLIARRDIPIVTWEEFNSQLIAAARKFDRSNLLTSTRVELSKSKVDEELQSRCYIQQLRWVECSKDELAEAVNSYLRSSIDRTVWSERGDVVESSFEEFSEQLKRLWASRKRLVAIELPGRSETDLGQAVLMHCLKESSKLQGLEVPSYFVPGSYHTLADSFTIGWHPRFEELRKHVQHPSSPVDAGAEPERGKS